MNSKKIAKIGAALLIIGAIFMAINMVCAAVSIPSAQGTATSGLQTPVQNIMGIVSYICYGAAVIMLVLLGVRYVSASPEGKAEIKKTAVQYVIGAALIFAAGAIIGIIRSVSESAIGATGTTP